MKIVAATMMVIFSLFTVFSGTFAWFTATRSVNIANNNFDIKSMDGRFAKATFHRMFDKENDPLNSTKWIYNFERRPCGMIEYDWTTETCNRNGDTDVVLEGYDYLDHEQPVLMLIELQKEYTLAEGAVKITAKTNDQDEVFIGERGNEEDDFKAKYPLVGTDPDTGEVNRIKKTDGEGINYYAMSSAVRFNAKSFTTAQYNSFYGSKLEAAPESGSDEYNFISLVESTLNVGTLTWDNRYQACYLETSSTGTNHTTRATTLVNALLNVDEDSNGVKDFHAVTPLTNCVHYGQDASEATVANDVGYVTIIAYDVQEGLDTVTYTIITVGIGDTYYCTINQTELSSDSTFVTVNNATDVSTFNPVIDPVYTSTGNVHYIALVIDYFSDAIEYIYSTFLGDGTLEYEYANVLHFVCDWSLEVI